MKLASHTPIVTSANRPAKSPRMPVFGATSVADRVPDSAPVRPSAAVAAARALRNSSDSGSFHHRSGTMSRPAMPPAAKSRCQFSE